MPLITQSYLKTIADTVEFEEFESQAVSLFELKDYYQHNKGRLLSNFEVSNFLFVGI